MDGDLLSSVDVAAMTTTRRHCCYRRLTISELIDLVASLGRRRTSAFDATYVWMSLMIATLQLQLEKQQQILPSGSSPCTVSFGTSKKMQYLSYFALRPV